MTIGIVIKSIIELIAVAALLYGYTKEEQIANWEREVLLPFVKELFKGGKK